MASKAGPARAAGKLAPSGTGQVVLGPRKVRVDTRSGTVRTKKGADTPSVELELGAGERLLDFVIGERGGPGLLAPLEKQAKFQARKTTDWDWEATVEVPVEATIRRSTSNGRGGRS